MQTQKLNNKFVKYGIVLLVIVLLASVLFVYAAASGGKLSDSIGFESKEMLKLSEPAASGSNTNDEISEAHAPLLNDLVDVALSVDVSYRDGYFTDSLPNSEVIQPPFTRVQTAHISVPANDSSASLVKAKIVSGSEYLVFVNESDLVTGNEILVENGITIQPKNTPGFETGTATIKVTAEDGDFIEEKTFNVVVGAANGETFPYLISDANDFEKIRQKIPNNQTAGTHYVMVNDIDFEEGEWTPIGIPGAGGKLAGTSFEDFSNGIVVESFSGTFDGGGYTFSNYTITANAASGEQYRGINGFFASVNNASISNFSLENGIMNIAVSDNFAAPNGFKGTSVYAGQLAGVANGKNTVIDNCSANGTILIVSNSSQNVTVKSASGAFVQTSPEVVVGGLVGLQNGRISDSLSDVQILAAGKYNIIGGGIAGKSYGSISNSSSFGNIEMVGGTDDLSFNKKHGSSAGGIAGFVSGGKITDSYSIGNVTLQSVRLNDGNGFVADYRIYAGGVAGIISNASVQNSYSAGSVKALGGFGLVPEGGEEILLYDELDVSDVLGNTGKQIVSDPENQTGRVTIPEGFVYGGFAGGIAGMSNETSAIRECVAANPEVIGSAGSARIVGTAGGFDIGFPSILDLGDKYTWKSDGTRTAKSNSKAADNMTLASNSAYNNMLIGTEENPEYAIGFIGQDKANGKGETSAFLKTKEAYKNWDFENIWKMNTYPIFKWQDEKN
ncbi:hypothetical protein [Methanolapillus millepedarum]|uniref:GLUG domain-containing protein n=1 Tax=Methanolapillus millepedarum TaxID=3028296 RepID=A0AA96V1Y4_9EURY|nr:hypothetical protein MsAc7_05010 [Methanosarcinaceae archaeon Ac7]